MLVSSPCAIAREANVCRQHRATQILLAPRGIQNREIAASAARGCRILVGCSTPTGRCPPRATSRLAKSRRISVPRSDNRRALRASRSRTCQAPGSTAKSQQVRRSRPRFSRTDHDGCRELATVLPRPCHGPSNVVDQVSCPINARYVT
jgi:hypothetical protein